MSLNFVKSFLEAQDFKTSFTPTIGIEFNKKFTYFSLVRKYMERAQAEKRKLIIINFDLLFYKYIINTKSILNNFLNDKLTSELSVDKSINIFHFLYLKNSLTEKENYSVLFSLFKQTLSTHSLIIIGLDLMKEETIHNFLLSNRNQMNNLNSNLFVFSTDSSSNNLNEEMERKKNIIKSRLNFYIYEKANKIQNNKNLLYMEIYNMSKLTKDIAIFEYILNNNNKNKLPIEVYEFDKINVLLKEYKDLFEAREHEEELQPVSTFKLSLNEKELQAKNETVLPYLKSEKEKEESRITIDQEDLDELYEEDPDGDLDI